jgi:hypothetical protein
MSGASGQNFGEKEDFKLEEKVTAESEGIRLLCKFNYCFIMLNLQNRAIYSHMWTFSILQRTQLQVKSNRVLS